MIEAPGGMAAFHVRSKSVSPSMSTMPRTPGITSAYAAETSSDLHHRRAAEQHEPVGVDAQGGRVLPQEPDGREKVVERMRRPFELRREPGHGSNTTRIRAPRASRSASIWCRRPAGSPCTQLPP